MQGTDRVPSQLVQLLASGTKPPAKTCADVHLESRMRKRRDHLYERDLRRFCAGPAVTTCRHARIALCPQSNIVTMNEQRGARGPSTNAE